MWAGRAILLAPSAGRGDDGVRAGATGYSDSRDDAPDVRRLITPADLPGPYATPLTSNPSQPSGRPASTFAKAPAGLRAGPVRGRLVGARTDQEGIQFDRSPSRRRMTGCCAERTPDSAVPPSAKCWDRRAKTAAPRGYRRFSRCENDANSSRHHSA